MTLGNQMKNTALKFAKAVGCIATMTIALMIGSAYQATFGGYVIISVFGLVLYVIAAAISVPIFRFIRHFVRLISSPQ